RGIFLGLEGRAVVGHDLACVMYALAVSRNDGQLAGQSAFALRATFAMLAALTAGSLRTLRAIGAVQARQAPLAFPAAHTLRAACSVAHPRETISNEPCYFAAKLAHFGA